MQCTLAFNPVGFECEIQPNGLSCEAMRARASALLTLKRPPFVFAEERAVPRATQPNCAPRIPPCGVRNWPKVDAMRSADSQFSRVVIV